MPSSPVQSQLSTKQQQFSGSKSINNSENGSTSSIGSANTTNFFPYRSFKHVGRPPEDFSFITASVGGTQTRCIVDSGSNVSIVSLPFVINHKLPYEKVCLPITQVNSATHTAGRLTTEFVFHGYTIRPTFIVLENFPRDVIVGRDIGRSFRMQPSLHSLDVLFRLPPDDYILPFSVLKLNTNFTYSSLMQSLLKTAVNPNMTLSHKIVPPLNTEYDLSTFFVDINVPFETSTKRIFEIYNLVCSCEVDSLPTPNYSDSQKDFLSRFHSIFSSDSHIGEIIGFEHNIRLKKSEPIALKAYPKSEIEAKMIREIVRDLLNKGFIRLSFSPYAFPVSLVPK